jgi:hypothetical protein
MEVWWIGQNGSVQGAYWYEGGSWGLYQLAPAGSAAPYTEITAVSRISTSMELWWTGNDGSVQDANWYEGGHWQRFRLAGGSLGDGFVTAVSRINNSMEVFWMGSCSNNGCLVQDSNYYEIGGWHQFQLSTGASSYSGASRIAAVSRASNTMEVWWIGQDGSVQDAYWYQ